MVYEPYGCDFDSYKEEDEKKKLHVLFSLFLEKWIVPGNDSNKRVKKNNKMKFLRG